MRYKSFRIRNFKGIKDTTIDLQGVAGASVFAFVGLNESGKTTILEAIHSFSPDGATEELLGVTGVPFKDRVPRHLISEFSGYVSVIATLSVTADDKKLIAKRLLSELKLTIDEDAFPDEVVFDRQQKFESGDFKVNYLTLRTKLKVKGDKQRKWRDPDDEESLKIRNIVYERTPDIAYFPTFVFAFPPGIYLTERGGRFTSSTGEFSRTSWITMVAARRLIKTSSVVSETRT
jgi:hypothetical protein